MNNEPRAARLRRPLKAAAMAAATILTLAGCGAVLGGDEAAEPAPEVSTGSADQLCATAAQFADPLATAADLSQLADAKVAYLQAARITAPPEWVDNIDIILPAWTTLVEVIVAADGDATKIDFDKFRADFADATANDAALESFVQSRCTPS